MRAKSLIFGGLCLLLASACALQSPAGPSAGLDVEFTLAPAESAAIKGTRLRVEFVTVSGDSRCPADVFCIQGGDAVVHVRARDGDMADYELHTGDSSRAAARHDGFVIELVNLQPYPFSSRVIQPGDYRATLKVSR